MKLQEQKMMGALMATLFLGVAEALAQDQQNLSTETTDEPTRRIIVSIADRKLALVEDGRIVKIYPAAVGAAATPSPTGVFKIVNRVKNPTWYGPKGKIVQPGKSNPLGDRWMGLDKKGYGIHGTNQPASIGRAASHGCIRMAKADLDELFSLVKVGDVVEMVSQPAEEISWIFESEQLIASAE